MLDVVDIGASELDDDNNVLLVQAKSAQVGTGEDDAPSFGKTPMACGLGVTCRPYPKTAEGGAQGVVAERLPGTNGWLIGARDTREFAAKVVAELGAGETALHSVGPGFDSRVFCKEQLVAIVIGDDVAIVVDRKNKQITASGWGAHHEVSEAGGVYMAHGGAMVQVKDGNVRIVGTLIINNATMPLLGGTPGSPTPIPGAFGG